MSAPFEHPTLLRFSVYELDLATNELRRQGRAVRLPPKALQLLKLLATRSGELVTRDEIKAFLWPSTVVDFDRNINLLINKIRDVLSDNAENPHYIETLQQKGYRFIFPVSRETRAVNSSSETLLSVRREASTRLSPGQKRESNGTRTNTDDREEQGPIREADTVRRHYDEEIARRGLESALHALLIDRVFNHLRSPANRRVWILASLVISLLLVAVWYLSDWQQHSPQLKSQVRLAVLPVENLTGDPGREYVADGLTEEIISQLGSLDSSLAIIARTSVMPYKHTEKTVAQIGRELQVDYVLECSLRQWEGTVRISAQLIAVRDQTHVWVRTFQSTQRDILKMQSEIADAVAIQAGLTFSSKRETRASATHPLDPRVYELFLRGRYEWRKRTGASLKKAIEYLKQAIALDPQYAPAYADLASVYVVLPYYGDSSPKETFPEAKAAAERAVQLNETLAEAHTVLGLVECSYLNISTGEREYQRALQLNPNYATAHHWHSFCLWMMNRRGDAVNELETARQLDPLSWIIYADEALTLSADHENDRAVSLLKTVIESEPEFAEAHRALGVVYVQTGEMPQAIKEAQRAVQLDPNNYAQATLGYVYGSAGKTAEANKVLAELTNPSRRPRVRLIYLSYVYIGLGQKDKALNCLQRAYLENSLLNAVNSADVILDPLRSEPRFLELAGQRSGVVTHQD